MNNKLYNLYLFHDIDKISLYIKIIQLKTKLETFINKKYHIYNIDLYLYNNKYMIKYIYHLCKLDYNIIKIRYLQSIPYSFFKNISLFQNNLSKSIIIFYSYSQNTLILPHMEKASFNQIYYSSPIINKCTQPYLLYTYAHFFNITLSKYSFFLISYIIHSDYKLLYHLLNKIIILSHFRSIYINDILIHNEYINNINIFSIARSIVLANNLYSTLYLSKYSKIISSSNFLSILNWFFFKILTVRLHLNNGLTLSNVFNNINIYGLNKQSIIYTSMKWPLNIHINRIKYLKNIFFFSKNLDYLNIQASFTYLSEI